MSLFQSLLRVFGVSRAAAVSGTSPVLLQPEQLKSVTGAGPNGTWKVVAPSAGPNGTW